MTSPDALSIKENMVWNTVGSLVNLGCQWFISILVVWLSFGYESAGVYALAVAVFGIFSSVAQYRMYTYQVSDVRNENTTGEYLAFRFVTSGMAFALVLVYSFATCSYEYIPSIACYSAYKVATLFVDVFHACDQRYGRMDYVGKSLAMQGISTTVSFAVVFFVGQSLEISFLSMTLCVAIIGVVYDRSRAAQFEAVVIRISLKKTKYLLVKCFPVVIAGIIAAATPSIPRQYLSYAMGSEALGIFASVAAPVAIIQMGANYVYSPLLGYFSLYYSRNNRSAFWALFGKSTFAICLIALVCIAVLLFAGEPLLALMYGDSIRPYTYLLIPLVIFALLNGYSWFLNDLLISFRDFKGTVIATFVGFFVMIATCVPLINECGMLGVAYTGIVSSLAFVIAMACALWCNLSSWGQ